ncbi:hypothetical protein pdam_00023924, partial [Pocillopora damicornis]
MNKAEREILRHVQRESLEEEIAILQATGSGVRIGDFARTGKGQIEKSSRVSKLDPWLMNGLLRWKSESTLSDKIARIDPLSVEEMNKAEREILRHLPRESFKEEIAILQATGSG